MKWSFHNTGQIQRERVFLEELRQCGEVAEVKCYGRVGVGWGGTACSRRHPAKGADDLPYAPDKKLLGIPGSSLCLHLGVSLGPEDSWTVIKEHSRLNLSPRAPQTAAQQLAAITGSVMGGLAGSGRRSGGISQSEQADTQRHIHDVTLGINSSLVIFPENVFETKVFDFNLHNRKIYYEQRFWSQSSCQLFCRHFFFYCGLLEKCFLVLVTAVP